MEKDVLHVSENIKTNAEKETIVHYTTVYEKVDRLYDFLHEEILKQNEILTRDINGNLEFLKGHANNKFIEATYEQSQKTQMIGLVLEQLLSFINESALSYEILDNDLSSEIGVEG